jgi:hypothetical protein
LDKAIREKITKIDKQCQRETVETWKVNMSAKRLEKMTYERKIQEEAAIRQRTKTAMKQKVELHEAYQLLLREHHIRVKRRARQKILAVSMMKNMTMPTSSSAKINSGTQDEKVGLEDTNKNQNKGIDQQGKRFL